MLRLRTLGGLSIENAAPNGGLTTNRRPLALLALLAVKGRRGLSRDSIVALLWPESDADRGRNSLSQVISALRRELGVDDVLLGTAELRLNPDVLSCDVTEFEQRIAADDLEASTKLYAGPFLDGVFLKNTPEFERWVDEERVRLQHVQCDALDRLATRATAAGDHIAAVRFWRQRASLTPSDSRTALGLMQSLAASGDRAGALGHYRAHHALLRADLGIEPDASLVTFAAALRARDVRSAEAASKDARPSQTPTPAPPPQNHVIPSAARDLPSRPSSATRRTWWRRRTIVSTTIGLVVAVGAGATYQLSSHRSFDNVRELAVVADFKFSGADSGIADVLTVALRRALSESRSLGAAPESRVGEVLSRLRIPTGARLDLRLARQVALGDRIKTVIDPSLVQFNGGYALSIRLIAAASGDVLTSAEVTVDGPGKLIGALDSLSRVLRERAGDALNVIRAAPPLEALTSSSLEAMSKYAAGRRATMVEGSFDKARDLFQEAVTLDTSFAAALIQLQLLLENTRHGTEADRRNLLARAYSHRDRLTEFERLHTEAWYLYSSNGTTPSRGQFVERMRQIVDRDPTADDVLTLANMHYQRHEVAAAESLYRRAIALDSTKYVAYANVVMLLVTDGRLAAARTAVDGFARRFPAVPLVPQLRAGVAYAEGRRDLARAAWLTGTHSSDEQLSYASLARLDLLEGRVAAWNRDVHAAVSRDSAAGRSPLIPFAALMANFWVLNRPIESLQMLDKEIAADSAQRRNLLRAVLYAQFDRPSRARAMLAAYDSVVKDTLGGWFQGTGRREVKGWILLADDEPLGAIAEFRASLMLSDGPANPTPIGADAPIGLAFERADMKDSAIVTYEHFLDTPFYWRFREDAFQLPWVLEHVAALYEATGRRDKARAAYERFVSLWKDADPELQPRVTRARQRIAALSTR